MGKLSLERVTCSGHPAGRWLRKFWRSHSHCLAGPETCFSGATCLRVFLPGQWNLGQGHVVTGKGPWTPDGVWDGDFLPRGVSVEAVSSFLMERTLELAKGKVRVLPE